MELKIETKESHFGWFTVKFGESSFHPVRKQCKLWGQMCWPAGGTQEGRLTAVGGWGSLG